DLVTGVQTCALPISDAAGNRRRSCDDVGAVDRGGGGRRVGERLVEGLRNAGGRLRIGGADGGAGVEGGDLRRRRLLRCGGGITQIGRASCRERGRGS